MRLALTAVLVMGLSAAGAAQSSMPRSAGSAPLPTIGLPLPTISLPLPRIGLPLPRTGLPPIGQTAATTAQPRGTNTPHGGPRAGGRARGSAVIYFIPTGGLGYPTSADLPTTPAARENRVPPTGRLRLELQPGVVPQVFVDGYYVGTLDDINGELILEPGRHGLDVRAEGYERLQFGVQISAGRSITYQGTLKTATLPQAASSSPVAQPAAPTELPPPTTIYVIPGCYVGNVPPKDAGLPAACDAGRVTTLPPMKR